MTFLPIVGRELRVAARKPSTYWFRCGAALCMIALGGWLLLVMWRQPPKEMAQALFFLLTGSVMLYSLLSGLRHTSDALSVEKREGTLGLLFLTDLRGYDIVLGKLMANSLHAFYWVLAVTPIMTIPLLLGSVTAGEIARVSLVTLNTLFLSLALGLCASALFRSAQGATAVTATTLLLLAFACPAISAGLTHLKQPVAVQTLFLVPSPGATYVSGLAMHYPRAKKLYWTGLGAQHTMAWAALLAASLWLPVSWHEKGTVQRNGAVRQRWRKLTHGSSTERVDYRRRLLDRNAFFWLAARVRSRAAGPWYALALAGGVWFGFYVKYRSEWLSPGVYVVTGILLVLVCKSWFANEATRQIAEERQSGTFELLLSTPLKVEDILDGQWLALKRQFLAPVCVICVILLILLRASLADMIDTTARGIFAAIWIGGMVMFIADLAAIYWVGMWQGLTARNPQRAASNTLAWIFLLPWGAVAMLVVLVSVTAMRGGGSSPEGMFFFYAWLSFGLTANLIFTAWARDKLLTQFRVAATRRHEKQLGLWERLKRLNEA